MFVVEFFCYVYFLGLEYDFPVVREDCERFWIDDKNSLNMSLSCLVAGIRFNLPDVIMRNLAVCVFRKNLKCELILNCSVMLRWYIMFIYI